MDYSQEKFDIIIQGGQSNAEGCGYGPVCDEYIPSPEILYLLADKQALELPEGVLVEYADKPFSIEIAKERISGENIFGDFSLTFAAEYIKNGLLAAGRKLLIVRAAIGGTGFQKHHWGVMDKVYLKMLEMVDYALSLNSENRVVAFLWHQGEHDAFEGNIPENFQAQLTALLNAVRTKYGRGLPFIAADFASEWKNENINICEPIVDKIRQVVKQAKNTGFIETSDLLSNNQKFGSGDKIHFCRQSLHDLGRRYFNVYKKIKENYYE